MATTVGAGDDEGSTLSSCAGTGPDRFFSVEVPADRVLSVKAITGGAWRAVVRLRTRSCTEPDDLCSTAAPGVTTASVSTNVRQATRFLITVDGVDATAAGPFELQVETRALASDGGLKVDGGVEFCKRLLAAQARFFGAKTRCEDTDAGVAFIREVTEPVCVARYPFCTATDLVHMNAYLSCYEAAVTCVDGAEARAMSSILACTAPIVTASTNGTLTGTCRDALRR